VDVDCDDPPYRCLRSLTGREPFHSSEGRRSRILPRKNPGTQTRHPSQGRGSCRVMGPLNRSIRSSRKLSPRVSAKSRLTERAKNPRRSGRPGCENGFQADPSLSLRRQSQNLRPSHQEQEHLWSSSGSLSPIMVLASIGPRQNLKDAKTWSSAGRIGSMSVSPCLNASVVLGMHSTSSRSDSGV
jgi:hypothetical protein